MCTIAIDVNRDGLDDLVLCNRGGNSSAAGLFYEQMPNGRFRRNIWKDTQASRNWRNARVADLTGDGVPDLAVVTGDTSRSFLRVFRGIRRRPWFDFTKVYYERSLPFAAPDLEAIDINGDGILDLYVVQVDERTLKPDGSPRPETYCAGSFHPDKWWPVNKKSPQSPPNNFVPPCDMAPDIVFLGRRSPKCNLRFKVVRMKHKLPGCGYYVKKFGPRALVLAQGGFVRPGHQLLLEW